MSHSQPRISVIVPCYNVEPYVEDCLDSLIHQTTNVIELIVVDDASTDGTWKKIEKYEQLPFVTTVKLETNGGLGAARNRGISLSRGDYLLFVDSDDWLVAGALDKLASFIDSRQPDLVFFDYARVYPRVGMIASPYFDLFENAALAQSEEERKTLLLGFPPMAWFKLYRRAFIADSGIEFGVGFYEDISWTYPLTLLAERIEVIPDVLYCYRQREGSILKSKGDRHLDLIAEYSKVLGYGRNLESGRYENQIISKMVAHFELMLFEFSRRLDWTSLRLFFDHAHSQLSSLELAARQHALDSAPSKASVRRRQSILEGNFSEYLKALVAFKFMYSFRRPFNLARTYFSSRRITT